MLNKIICFFVGHIPVEQIDDNVLCTHGQNANGQLPFFNPELPTYALEKIKTIVCKRCKKLIERKWDTKKA